MSELEEKERTLEEYLKTLGNVVVAFSAGVDSTLLLYKAQQVLGDSVMAVTSRSSLVPEREWKAAEDFCKSHAIQHIFLDIDELEVDGFEDNPRNRCYLCKTTLFTHIKKIAAEHGFPHVAEGSNMDDLGDYRPGLQAIAELGIKSPLREAELYKAEIRELSKKYDLPTWKKPASACLASRFVYGEKITKPKLGMVEQAEQFLADLGLGQFRVRIHGENLARIEVQPDEMGKMADKAVREKVVEEFKKIGFQYVTLDLQGYRMGSMNEVK